VRAYAQPVLTVAVLGPVEVCRDSAPLIVPGGKTTEVLIRLALDAGTLVPTDRLIEDLWAEQAVGVARNTLQAKVSKLRRVLGDAALVTGSTAGYTLTIDPSCVDAIEVLRLAAVVGAERAAGRADAAVLACLTALAMFRGDILPGAGDGEWLTPHRARLQEVWLHLTEDHLGARLDLGAAGELVAELEALVAAHPLREELWKLLITALYRGGRQADALAAYGRVRQRLAEELGLDPGAELHALEQRVLRHDVGLDAPMRGGPVVPVALPRGNLPGMSSTMIGRAGDLAAVTGLMGEQRLMTVVGPAGVGKTRLAIEAAYGAAPPGGAWLVRLDDVRTGATLWPSVGEALAIDAATEAMVLDRLRGSDLLLVLDNCEHLVEMLAEPVTRMLTATPGVRVLATSQVPLGVLGEVVYPLEPLPLTDSVALFASRAAQQRRSFSVDADTQPVIEAVCRSLDGLPLAIELAAARSKVLSVQEIARRLSDRFTLLSDPTGRRPPRQRTLGAALAWSYDLLFPDDQRGLWALACFSGGAPLAAAEHVLAALGVPEVTTLDVLGRLADRSLLSVDIAAGGAVRYRLLDSVREFSVTKAREAGIIDAGLRAHTAWFADAAARAEHGIRGPDQGTYLTMARTERANIDAALTWAKRHDPVLGLRIANGFAWTWGVLGAGPDAVERCRSAFVAAQAVAEPRELTVGLLLIGWLEASGGNLDHATADIEQAMRFADVDLQSVGQLYLSFVRTQQGRAQDALTLLADCRIEFHRRARSWEEGASWLLTAWAELALGETERGRAACDAALRSLLPFGDQWALNHAEALLGTVAQTEHRFTDAVVHLRRAAEATHHLGFTAAEAHHLMNLGRLQQQSGDPEAAIATLERAVATARTVGDLRTAAIAGVRLGCVQRAAGDPGSARTVARSAQRWYDVAGGGDGAILAGYLLAALDADDGAPHAAERLADVLAAARLGHDVETEVLTLDTLALVHAERRQMTDSRMLLDAADRVMLTAGHLVTDNDRSDGDRARSLLELADATQLPGNT
jgi:predicted ATPase/DNA-binding SARP family transcriptional activator